MSVKLDDLDVLFVCNALAGGGAERVVSLLANEFAGQGKRVGIAVYNLRENEYPVSPEVLKEYGPAVSGPLGKLRRIFWLRGIVRANPCAKVIAFEYFVNMQAVLACWGLPNQLAISERNDPSRVGAGKEPVRTRLYRRADLLVCQTGDAAEYFSSVPNKRIILNPLKDSLPEPFSGERSRRVVSFCRLMPQKNLVMLLRGFAKFSETHNGWTLEVYGDGEQRDELVSLAESLGISDRVCILPGRTDVHDIVLDAGMFVLPSDYEGLSNSMLEAMAIGLPVICTDCPCGGARMMIRDGENGLLVPVGDEGALVAAMRSIAENPGYALKLGENAACIRERLSLGAIAADWADALGLE